jgi:hypothetical protein
MTNPASILDKITLIDFALAKTTNVEVFRLWEKLR